MAKSSKKKQKAPLEPVIEYMLTFDGQDDFITCPEGIVTSSYTKEAWIKLAEPLAQYNNILSGYDHALYMPNGGCLASGHNNQWEFVKDSSASPANTWLHVAVTYDSQTQVMCLYRDGQLISQASNVPPFTASDRILLIGSHRSSALFKGQIAEVRVWNKVLSQTEVQSNLSHRLVGDEPGLVSYWPLNEGSGAIAQDKTSNANHATIHGNPTWEVSTLSLVDATPSESEDEEASSSPETPTQTSPAPTNAENSPAVNLPTGSKIKLKSWKGDYLHRPDSAQGVTTWDTGVGNEWTVEAILSETATPNADHKIKLKSWKGDYLHRPDSAQGVTTWDTGVGNEWTVEAILSETATPNADHKIKLKSWKGDYLHRPDSPPDVTTWNTGVGNEWEFEVISIQEPTIANINELLNKPVLIENQETRRYLFCDGEPIKGNRGDEGGWLASSGFESPKVVGADANYYNRALWTIVPNGDTFLIENQETKRYLFCDGEPIKGNRGDEGGWLASSGFESPKVVGADANYYNHALWTIVPNGDTFLIENQKTKRYLFCDGEPIKANRGDEGGWLASSGFESPKVVGADANYYNRALWTITLGIDKQPVESANTEFDVVEQPSQSASASPNISPSPSPVSPEQFIPLEQSGTFPEPASASPNVAPSPLLPIEPTELSPSATPVPAIAPPIPPVALQGRQMVLVLDEKHQGISAGGGALRPQGRFTIEAWVYLATDAGKQVIYAEGGTLFYLEGGELKFHTRVATEAIALSATPCVIASVNAGITSGSWYHVAVVRGGSRPGDTKLYINGVHNDNQTAISSVLTFGNTYLGGDPDVLDSRFQGKLLEVRVWRYGRSQAEIQENMLYFLTGRELGLVRCWTLNEGFGTTISGKTTNRVGGTVIGDATWEESEIPIKINLNAEERLTRSTGLEDYGYWFKEMAKQQKTEADPPFRRGRIWA